MSTRTDRIRVAVAGASGYTGAELIRLLTAHPRVTITAVTAEKSAGARLAAVFPSLRGLLPDLVCEALDPQALAARADVIFLALPHTKSLDAAAAAVSAGRKVIDLSADYRLRDAAVYQQWYGTAHTHDTLLKEAVYGLPELYREQIRQARLVASPGCYPTAAILQLAPLVARNLVDPATIVIDAKSGISGAGRSPALPYHFPEAHEALEAYNVGKHRHLPEIEQELSALQPKAPSVRVVFTPHLVPMNRGILSTAYCKLRDRHETAALRSLYREHYKGEPFVQVCEDVAPNPRYLKGANTCQVTVHADARTGWAVTVAALDNLVKGAGGQAIQAMNLMLGFPEETGLTGPGVYP